MKKMLQRLGRGYIVVFKLNYDSLKRQTWSIRDLFMRGSVVCGRKRLVWLQAAPVAKGLKLSLMLLFGLTLCKVWVSGSRIYLSCLNSAAIFSVVTTAYAFRANRLGQINSHRVAVYFFFFFQYFYLLQNSRAQSLAVLPFLYVWGSSPCH